MRPRGERETENEPRGKEAPVKWNREAGGALEASGRQRTDGADVRRAQREITEVLSAVAGRDHMAGREP